MRRCIVICVDRRSLKICSSRSLDADVANAGFEPFHAAKGVIAVMLEVVTHSPLLPLDVREDHHAVAFLLTPLSEGHYNSHSA